MTEENKPVEEVAEEVPVVEQPTIEQPSTETPPATPAEEPVTEEAPVMDDIEAGKTLAIIEYIIPILCIVPLIQKDNNFSLYHAKQVLLLVLASIVVSIASTVLAPIFCIGGIIAVVGGPFIFVLFIMGLINAINEKAVPVPLIGKFAVEWFKGIKKV